MIGQIVLSIDVAGVPAQQGSKDAHHKNGRSWVKDSNEKNLKPWRRAIIDAASEAFAGQRPLAGAAAVSIDFRYARPKAHFGTGRNAHTLKPSAPYLKSTAPDVDKLTRAVLDALKQGGVYRDDGQVALLRECATRYVLPGGPEAAPESPGARITVWALEAIDLEVGSEAA